MDIEKMIDSLVSAIDLIDNIDEKVDTLNKIKERLSQVSPFKNEPVDCVIWHKQERIFANNYNPNSVAPPEMKLLEHSIQEDGYTQPIVSWKNGQKFEVVDGFHRNRIGKESAEIKERIKGYLPLTVIQSNRIGRKDRIAATIRHNRARGVHAIEPMSTIVAELYFSGWSNKKIAEELGMEKDEINRLKQFTGLGSLFTARKYSEAWE